MRAAHSAAILELHSQITWSNLVVRYFVWLPILFVSSFGLPPQILAGDSGGRVHYVGGTVSVLSSKTGGIMSTSGEDVFLFQTRDVTVQIPYQRINVLEYGQRVGRHYAEAILLSPMFLLSKTRKHYLTIGFTDAKGKQQAMIFEVGKGNIRSLLVSLEAKTGRRLEYQDDDARRSGKGS